MFTLNSVTFARGDGGRRSLPMAPEELLEAAMLIYMRGLGAGEALSAERGGRDNVSPGEPPQKGPWGTKPS